MEDTNSDEEETPVFKLADICKLYDERLDQLGVARASKVHSTHLKNKLLAYSPSLTQVERLKYLPSDSRGYLRETDRFLTISLEKRSIS